MSMDNEAQPAALAASLGDEDEVNDPLQEWDPWGEGGRGTARTTSGASDSELPQGIPTFGRRRGQGQQASQASAPTYAQVTLPVQDQGVSQRIIHDVPPVWDGKDPDNQAEPYLKLLRGWLSTTRTLKTQAGMTILHYACGDLKILINELDVDTLTHPDSGTIVYKHVYNNFKEHLNKKLPKALERAIWDEKGTRLRDETMLQYTSKKRSLLRELDRVDCELPSKAKGYLMLRGAKLNDRAWDMMETWLQGNYELDDVVEKLKQLERPIPGRGGATHLCGFVGDGNGVDSAGQDAGVFFAGPGGGSSGSCTDGTTLVFMEESLFLLPESFDDPLLDEVEKYIDNPEILYVAGDLSNNLWFEEDEAVSILANYGQVRTYLHKKLLGRGYNRPSKTQGRGGGPPPPRSNSQHSRPPARNTGRPKRWTKSFLISRSICARCGKKGHWARECKNEPDERGKMRQQNKELHGFMMTAESTTAVHFSLEDESPEVPCITDDHVPVLPLDADEDVNDGEAFVMTIFTGVELEIFIGLAVTPGYALVDTGAQHGVLGPHAFKQVCEVLAVHGLKPRIIDTLQLTATGVGGSTKFIQSAEIPVGIKGVSGILTIHMVQQEIPLLLPVSFCKQLGMVLDMPEMSIYWKAINRQSDVTEVGTSEHLAIEIFEFGKTGWKNPHSYPKAIVGKGHSLNKNIPRSAFELPRSAFGSSTGGTTLFGEAEDDVGSTSMQTSGNRKLQLDAAKQSSNVPAGWINAGTTPTTGTLEDSRSQTPLGTGNLRSQAPNPGSVGRGKLQAPVPTSSGGGTTQRSDTVVRTADQRRDHGPPIEAQRRSTASGSTHVQPPHLRHEAPRQQDEVVDMHSVSQSVGTIAGGGTARSPEGTRSVTARTTCGQNFPRHPRDGTSVCSLGPPDSGNQRGGGLATSDALGGIPPDQGAAERGGGIERDRRGRRGGERHLNRILVGNQLTRLLSLPLVGYVAQLVTAGCRYQSLEGDVFGDRVGTYVGPTVVGPWRTESGMSLSPGQSGVGDPILLNAPGAKDEREEPWRLILYKTVPGAFENSTEESPDNISVVPRSVLQNIRQKLEPHKSTSFPVGIDEEGEQPPNEEEAAQGGPSTSPLLPEERVGDDNAEPDSEEEQEPAETIKFEPTEQQLRDLKIAHDNSGHPSNADFARLLRRGNARPEVAAWVRRNFKCEECEAHQQPKARRPAAIPKTYRFNHVVGLDLVEVKNFSGEKHYWLNCICWGTSFQLVGKVGGDERKTA